MLSYVDRVQLVVKDREAAVERWTTYFGAEKVGEDGSRAQNAHRTTVQAGTSLFEFLEPAGEGPIQNFAEAWGEGLYGVGFSSPDVGEMARHLGSESVAFTEEGGALILDPAATHGMPTTIVAEAEREPVGSIRHLYEVTNPVADWQDAAALYTRIFGLNPTMFSRITSPLYGYDGTLTLFDPPGRLDRIEVTETSGGGAMDRFFQKRGPSLYMCYIEVDDVTALGERLQAAGARFAPSEGQRPGTGLFIHPSSLFGMLMGVSVKDYAWHWSGHPELVPAQYGAPAPH
ncbi:MAG: VOC family protein [Tepidiformaceae bacterium]